MFLSVHLNLGCCSSELCPQTKLCFIPTCRQLFLFVAARPRHRVVLLKSDPQRHGQHEREVIEKFNMGLKVLLLSQCGSVIGVDTFLKPACNKSVFQQSTKPTLSSASSFDLLCCVTLYCCQTMFKIQSPAGITPEAAGNPSRQTVWWSFLGS